MFLSGVQPACASHADRSEDPLDSRLKHAGMTDFGKVANSTQQAAGNWTAELQGELETGLEKRSELPDAKMLLTVINSVISTAGKRRR